MKTLTFNRCKDVPAPFWLFVLEKTFIRYKNENPVNVSKLDDVQSKWQIVKNDYKIKVQKLKEEIRLNKTTTYEMDNGIERKLIQKTNRNYENYVYQILQTDNLIRDEISNIDLYWELYNTPNF